MPAPFRAGALLLGCVGLLSACTSIEPQPVKLRVATYNLALTEDVAGGVVERLRGDDAHARKLAAVIQSVRPDILLLNELDRDEAGEAARLFRERYLSVGQFGLEPLDYPYAFQAPVNTGVDSGLDLDRNGTLGDPGDAWGFGRHPGQYGMLVLSRFPIDVDAARTFQHLRWADLPGAVGPLDPDTGTPWYPAEIWTQLRLSSKSHWDLPIDTPLGRIHLLAAHPTPPAFDGPERRNVVRNHDELQLWKHYLDGAGWIVDDQGRRGGLAADARFVIVGDLNADPADGASAPNAIAQVLTHARVQAEPAPRSAGSEAASLTFLPGNGETLAQRGDPATDTAEFNGKVGNLRVDYALPSVGFTLIDQGVFWPKHGEPGSDWVTASDHRMVWVELGGG